MRHRSSSLRATTIWTDPFVQPLVFHSPLPSVRRSPADRTAFGSKALYLSLQPDVFKLTNNCGSLARQMIFGSPYFNVNGLEGFQLAELLAFMFSSCVDCIVPINARVSQTQSRFYLRETRAELGPGVVCLVSSLATCLFSPWANPSKWEKT